MADNVGAIIVKDTGELVMPDRVAVILVVPTVIPVTKPAEPAEDMVALVESELAQFTREVMSAVEPFEYVPVAVNCWVRPAAKLTGEDGVTAIEDNVAAGADTGLVEELPVDGETMLT
jgi:hypothetical protein